jgi:hypothetical protein
MLRIFEGGIFTMICGPINDNVVWRRRYSNELFDTIYLLTAIGLTPGGSSTVHIYTQTHAVRWLGHIFRMQGLVPC